MGNCIPTALTLIDICMSLNITLSQIIHLNLINNNNEFSEIFSTDFQKLTDKEKNSVIQLIKYMANN